MTLLTTFNYLKKIYWYFFPATCILCHYPSNLSLDICQDCLDELPSLPQSCPRCANTLMAPTTLDLLCGVCLTEPPPFDATYALYRYQTPVTKLIMTLKFHHQLVNARLLGELMAHTIQHRWYQRKPLPDIIIPVPLHAKRLRERGFNQTLEIARPITRRLKLPIISSRCKRIKNTAAQAMLPANERAKNLENAFEIGLDLTNLHVAALDDVITTGKTMTEFCNALKKAGARRVDIWCCAKTLLR